MASPPLSLDHIIILVPYSYLQTPPLWITQNFTITPGGRHGDNKTENILICFQDGSYIEIIAFINDDPKLRKGHWWDKPFGIVDYAFTSPNSAAANFEEVQKRLEAAETEIRYEEPRAGQRERPDGELVKWQITFPVTTGGFQRGELPFFCHDVTDRGLRVPMRKENTTHPSSAYGVKDLLIYAPEAHVKVVTKAYSAIFNSPNLSEPGETDQGVFTTKRLVPVASAPETVAFTVQASTEERQTKAMEEREGVLLGDKVISVIGVIAPGGGITLRINVEA